MRTDVTRVPRKSQAEFGIFAAIACVCMLRLIAGTKPVNRRLHHHYATQRVDTPTQPHMLQNAVGSTLR